MCSARNVSSLSELTQAPDRRLYHMAAKMRDDGAVSALCFKRPRAIDIRRASWTIRVSAVTCKKCQRILNETAVVHA